MCNLWARCRCSSSWSMMWGWSLMVGYSIRSTKHIYHPKRRSVSLALHPRHGQGLCTSWTAIISAHPGPSACPVCFRDRHTGRIVLIRVYWLFTSWVIIFLRCKKWKFITKERWYEVVHISITPMTDHPSFCVLLREDTLGRNAFLSEVLTRGLSCDVKIHNRWDTFALNYTAWFEWFISYTWKNLDILNCILSNCNGRVAIWSSSCLF